MTTVLISGAGIAGPALARWLGRNGFDVTVVERAAGVRPGGQAVDVRGPTHRSLLERMGVFEEVRATRMPRTDWRLVDGADRVKAVLPGELLGGDLEILRGDLAAILHRHSAADAEYVFGDEILALRQTPSGVDIEFARGAARRYDIVVGADGVHSAVRRLAFGPDGDHLRARGGYYAVFGAAVPLDGLPTRSPDGRAIAYAYNEPGRLVVLGGQKAPGQLVFRAPGPDYDRHDTASQLRFVQRAFRGAGWRTPQALRAAADSTDFYLDALVRTRMTAFTRGRVALVGDAGQANTLGGFGTGLALIGAHVLAGELLVARGDHATAFPAYDRIMRRATRPARSGDAGRVLAPASRLGIRLRDLSFANPAMRAAQLRLARRLATDERIPHYGMA
ncbi:MAG: FAD-dependent monooxygenase [Microbacteriaceae bacterium]